MKLVRKLLKFIAYIILVYLAALLLIKVYFITQEKLYENSYPNINGYSYYKVDTNEYEPDYNSGDFVFLKNNEEVKLNDYILYKKDTVKGFNKVNEIKTVKNELDDIYKNYYVLADEDKTEISEDELLGVAFSIDKRINKGLRIGTNPAIIFFMMIFMFLVPSLTYKRYE